MATASIDVYPRLAFATINPNIFGHFAEHLGECIYGGIWVGEDSPIPNTDGIRNDIVGLLRAMKAPVIRWPGGCFADDYHWENGIGPRDSRPRTINIHWGEVIETNHFGTHEFLRLCELVGAQPYLCGNVGSGSPREMRDWVEYCNFPGDSTRALARAANGHPEPYGVRYWGVGNENWGCGGNFDPEDYAVEYKRFSTFLRPFARQPFSLIACGPNGNNVDWSRRFFTKLGGYRHLHGFAAHYYCGTAGASTEYSDEQWYQLLDQAGRMEPLVKQQRALLDSVDPDRRIGLIVDEWGTWHPAQAGRNPAFLWQQNTIRDGLVAALTLDIFCRHADKVVMGNIAQTFNVLQAMALTEGDKMVVTPTGHVFTMYAAHQGAAAVHAHFHADAIAYGANGHVPGLAGSASVKDGQLVITAINANVSEPLESTLKLHGAEAASGSLTLLSGADIHAHNTFEQPDAVQPRETALEVGGGDVTITLPPACVALVRLALR
jgi:alpha-N-arabinofuranosidase